MKMKRFFSLILFLLIFLSLGSTAHADHVISCGSFAGCPDGDAEVGVNFTGDVNLSAGTFRVWVFNPVGTNQCTNSSGGHATNESFCDAGVVGGNIQCQVDNLDCRNTPFNVTVDEPAGYTCTPSPSMVNLANCSSNSPITVTCTGPPTYVTPPPPPPAPPPPAPAPPPPAPPPPAPAYGYPTPVAGYSTLTVSTPACITPGYTGSGVNLNWSPGQGAALMIDTNSSFLDPVWVKYVDNFTTSATAPIGFATRLPPFSALTLNPNTPYYSALGYFTGSTPTLISNMVTFNIPECAPPPPPTCTNPPGTNQLTGCLYDGRDFNAYIGNAPPGVSQASPVADNPLFSSVLNYDWGTGTPNAAVGIDDFSLIWQGNFTFKAGTYTFYVGYDDGVRLKIDGNTVIDSWATCCIDRTYTIFFSTQAVHLIEMQYKEEGGSALARMRWTYAPPATLTVTTAGSGTGTVTSSPGGITCGAGYDWTSTADAAQYPITGASGVTTSAWTQGSQNACSNYRHLYCFEQPSSPSPSYMRVFLSAYSFQGDLGGLSGADSRCQSSADGFGLGGTWKAWLSSSTVAVNSAARNFTQFNGPYKLLDDTNTVANNWADLTDATTLLHAINLTETGSTVSENVWTNTTSAGNRSQTSSGYTCADCSESYTNDTVVTLTATPVSGSVFAGWSGVDPDCSDGIVTMDVSKTCTATFNLPPATLTVTTEGSGTVTSSPAGINCGTGGTDCSEVYTSGTPVTLTAAPAADSVFAGWSGVDPDCSDGIVTMDVSKTCTATFNTKADLTSATPTYSGVLVEGNPLTFSSAISNIGGTNANSFNFRFCINNLSCLTSIAGRVGASDGGPISVAAGAASATLTSSAWTTTTTGSHNIYICADTNPVPPPGTVNESNEGNNCNSIPFSVAAAISPWIQTSGGDVHSNESIYAPGGQ